MSVGTERPGRARVRTRLAADWPWITILLLTCGFQFGRGAIVDGIVFLCAALAVVADCLGWLRRIDRAAGQFSPPKALAIVGAATVAVGIGILPEFSVLTGVVVIATGVLAIAFAWPNASSSGGAGNGNGNGNETDTDTDTAAVARRRAAVAWSIILVLFCLWELVNFFLGLPSPGADWRHPALSDLLRPFWTDPALRACGVALWLLGGYALVRRSKAPR